MDAVEKLWLAEKYFQESNDPGFQLVVPLKGDGRIQSRLGRATNRFAGQANVAQARRLEDIPNMAGDFRWSVGESRALLLGSIAIAIAHIGDWASRVEVWLTLAAGSLLVLAH